MFHTPATPTHAGRNRQRDVNQLAKMIADTSTGEIPKEDPPQEREKNPAAVALGKPGAGKGGQVRALKLSSKKRKADNPKYMRREEGLRRWKEPYK